MVKREFLRSMGMITLFLFAWSCLATGFVRGAEEDPLDVARQLIKAGSFKEAEQVLGAYIGKIRGIAKQKRRVAEAHYLLAKMYYEVGDDRKCDEDMRAALQIDPEAGKEEIDPGFRKRLDGIRAEVAPKAFEKMKEHQLHPRKKFPWLLVAGAAIAAGILVILLVKKKSKNISYTLSVTVSEGVTGTFTSGSLTYPKGTSVPYHFETLAEFKDLTVKINGTVSASSGTLTMDRDIQLEVTATPMSAIVTLMVDGKGNCQRMVYSSALMTQVPAGSFTLQQIVGNAYHSATTPFGSVMLNYYGSDHLTHLAVLSIPLSSSLQVGDSTGGSHLFAFFIDSGTIANNSGEITLNFGSWQVKVHGKNNCFQLGDLPTAKVNVTSGTYRLRISGSAYHFGNRINEVLVVYPGSNGTSIYQALAVGSTTVFSTAGGMFHAFFTSYVNDANSNSGQIKIEFLQ